MPDRLPPSWGHEPEDGRDLDAVLSGQGTLSVEEIQADEAMLAGQLALVAESQRPVAGAMFALRSGPEESELAGEAAARAAFRAHVAPAVPGSQHTLVLPIQSAGQGQGSRAPVRHRHRRRTAGDRAGWRVVALAGSAAAVVAVGAAALTGAFSGPAGPGGQSANPTAAQLSTPRPAQTQRLLGGGQPTEDATPSATPKVSAAPATTQSQGTPQTPADLCREYYGFLPRSGGDQPGEKQLFDQLSKLAGSREPGRVFGYCMKQVPPEHQRPPRQAPPGGGWPPPGSPNAGNWGPDGRSGHSR